MNKNQKLRKGPIQFLQEELPSQTEAEFAHKEEFKKIKLEPEDNDGENKKPEKRATVFQTGIMIAKNMIGSGVLNVSLIFKTLGIIPGVLTGCLDLTISLLVTYYLLRCKDITQHYSYSLYSKLAFGQIGVIFTKSSIVLLTGTVCCIYFKIFGDLLRAIILIFTEDHGEFYFNEKFLLVVSGLILLPLMFKKDISALSKFSFIGMIALGILFISLIILFIYKYVKNELEPFSSTMLFPLKQEKPDYFSYFSCFAGFYGAFGFHFNAFPLYLPLTPRTSKNMLKATLLGGSIALFIYIVIGILGYGLYRGKIKDSLFHYIREDLISFLDTNIVMGIVLIICVVAFFINTFISTPLIFFSTKSNLFNLIFLIKKKFEGKERDKEANKGKELIEVSQKDPQDKIIKEEKDEVKNEISESFKIIIVIVSYIFIIIVAIFSKRIIELDGFNGSTFLNLICIIFPCLYFMTFTKGEGINLEKLVAILISTYGFSLMFTYIGFILQPLVKMIFK